MGYRGKVEERERARAVRRDGWTMPYRAVDDATIRRTKHVHGCPKVRYSCARTHRPIMGLIDALLAWPPHIPG